MSNSVRPHRRQLTRLCCPWDSPGKNTGVGCHFLLQCMKVKSESEVAQWFLTLSDPMVCSLSGSSVHGIFQARVLEWGAIAFSDICTDIPSLLSLPPSPPHPIPLGHRRAPSCAPCASHQRSISHMAMHMTTPPSQFIPPSPSPTVSTSLFFTSASLFLPCK